MLLRYRLGPSGKRIPILSRPEIRPSTRHSSENYHYLMWEGHSREMKVTHKTSNAEAALATAAVGKIGEQGWHKTRRDWNNSGRSRSSSRKNARREEGVANSNSNSSSNSRNWRYRKGINGSSSRRRERPEKERKGNEREGKAYTPLQTTMR